MSVLWKKVWFDLWKNKVRTLLAVLSISAGVFAVGIFFGMADLLTTTLNAAQQSIVAPHLDISLTSAIDRETALSVRNVAGVEDVQPYNLVSIQYRVDSQGELKQGVLYMLDDYNDQKYELVDLRDGRWPEKNDVGIERMAADYLKLGVGDSVTIKVDGGTEKVYPISGKIRHPFVPPPQFMDLMYFFADGETMERFGIPDGYFNNLKVRVTPYSMDHSKEAATLIKDYLGEQGIGIGMVLYQEPDRHWSGSMMESMNLVLQVLALFTLLMGAVLIYNTLSALVTQQTDQIGILKAIGGRRSKIIKTYLSGVLIYGLLAIGIALPLGAIVCFSICQGFLSLYNIEYNVFEVSKQTLILQTVAAIAVPLVAGLVPVLQGAAITVRQAISSYGLGGDFGTSRLDRMVERTGRRFLPTHYAASLGNMFRHKGRLIMTQLVMVTAGVMFLMVNSLNTSIDLTLDRVFARSKYDLSINFIERERIDRVTQMALSVDGVEEAEVWFTQSASLLARDQLVKEAGLSSIIQGIPEGSKFFEPKIISGRWLAPEDGRAIVLTRKTAQNNNIHVGDTVILNLGEMGKDEWQVVGLYEPVFAGPYNPETIYAPQSALFEATKKYGRGSMLYVRTSEHNPEAVAAIVNQLKDLYKGRNIEVAQSTTEHEARQKEAFSFSTLTSMLLVLAIIIAVVGGIALMGALSISVVERTKEIGVLRAIGARSRTVLRIFIMEGLLQGMLSWLVAVPLAFVFGNQFAVGMGNALFNAALEYRFAWGAVMVWLLVVMIISVLAAILPARSATRVSVRNSLAYV
ncbi:MAG: FtsX-like permease family protein [Anaerolineales bacterium]|nr:FtsX-like permease family protein [Anaerolineales bacterium]